MTTAKQATFLSSLGAALEYYDFIVYGMMASILSSLFFVADEPWIAIMKAYGVFAVGYLARPVGGMLFGALGDVYGRKTVFTTVMFLMAFSTLGIGLLPTHAAVGAIGLIFFRLIQGISFGAELPGAITVVCEYTEKKVHGVYSGFVLSSVTVGSILASLILYLTTTFFSQEMLLSWGWRLPFLLGGVLAIVSAIIRNRLSETPEFERKGKSQSIGATFGKLFKGFLPQVIRGVCMTALLASLVLFVLYFPTYLKDFYGYSASDIYLAMTVGLVWSAISMPICGLLADSVSKPRLYKISALAFAMGIFPLFALLQLGGITLLILFMCLYQTVISLLSVCCFPIIAASFPTDVRYLGIATSYNIAYSIFGALPVVMTSLIHYAGTPLSALWLLAAIAIVAAATLNHK